MDKGLRKKAILEFGATMLVVLALFAVSVVKTNAYNRAKHAAADDMLRVFNQSSVLIQANETSTEFYGG